MCRCTWSTDTESLALADMAIRAIEPRCVRGSAVKDPQNRSVLFMFTGPRMSRDLKFDD